MNNKGVTLIELLVALAIFSIATVFLAYTITATIRHNFRNSLRDMAATILNNTINNLKTLDYDNITDKNQNECDKISYYFGSINSRLHSLQRVHKKNVPPVISSSFFRL